MADRFDKFTERARKVLQLAQEEAQRFNHNYIGTEHLLLGLVREGEGVAAKVLANLGVELNKVRSAVEFIIGRGDRTVTGDIGLTPRAKKVIELSVDEARRLNHHYIGTEHLLLGLVREGEGIAAGVLESLGVSLDKVRSQVIYVLNQSATHPPQPAGEQARIPEPWDPTTSFSRLTARTRRVLLFTSEEAQQIERQGMGTEHLLVGLVREGRGVSGAVLKEFGVELERVRSSLEIARGDREAAEPGLTPGLKRVLTLAFEEMHGLGHSRLFPEHLILGLLREGGDGGASALRSLDVDFEALRARMVAGLARASRRAAVREAEPDAARPTRPAVLKGPIADPSAPLPKLTGREREVLTYRVQGLTNQQVATQLHVTPDTVKRHVVNIMRKLGAPSGTQAAVFAIRTGMLAGPPSVEQRSAEEVAEGNKSLARAFFEQVLGEGRLEAGDEIFADSVAVLPHGGGRAAINRSVVQLRATFSALTVAIEEQVAARDRVVTRWRAQGIHQREFLGVLPTRKRVSVSGVHVHRVVDGRIVQVWEQIDAADLLRQLADS
jgi:DNA-binding CsgD family transcriptional regulator/predicted ester cyclase